MDTVGYIGVGKMGGPVAAHIQAAGFPMVVHDLSADARAPFVARGAKMAGTAAEVARLSDVVFTALPTPKDVETAALGPEGIIQGIRPNGIYVVRFRNTKDGPRSKDFMRGYGFQGGSHLESWSHAHEIPGFGAGFKRRVREERPWRVRLAGFGECLPRFENYCELDPEKTLALASATTTGQRGSFAGLLRSATDKLKGMSDRGNQLTV